MKIVNFPQGPSRLATIENSLLNASLSMIKQSVELLTQECAQSVFSINSPMQEVMVRTEQLKEHEIELYNELCQLSRELGILALQKDFLTPEAVEDALEELQQKIFSKKMPVTKQVKDQYIRLKREWNRLYFLFQFPVAEELNPDSFQSNFISRVSDRIKKTRQLDPKRADQLKILLKSLIEQCKTAKAIFLGDHLANSYRRLPKEIKLAVERYLFMQDPQSTIQEIIEKEHGHYIVAGAIMEVLMDRLMDIDLSN